MTDKNGQNRGGARTPDVPYRKVRLEFWDLFSKLVESNHMLTTSNERENLWLRQQFDKIRELTRENDDLRVELEEARHDWRMCDEVCDQKQFKISELEHELHQLKQKRLN